MKRQVNVDAEARNQFQQALRITRSVKYQIFVIAALAVSAVVAYVLGEYTHADGHLQDFFLGLSGNLAVAVVIFLFLDRGIKSLHPISEIRSFPANEFIEGMKFVGRGDRIRILETFTSLTNDHYEEFSLAVREALRRGAKIEILLFHPYSEGAIKRAQQLQGKTNVEEEIRKNLARLYNLQITIEHKIKRNFEVKLYTALPSIAMYRWGDWAFVSLFPIGSRADNCPNLRVPMDNPFGSYADDTFNELWDGTIEAPTLALHQHMRLCMESAPSNHELPEHGYYFAYDEQNGVVNRSQCYLVEESKTFFLSIYEAPKEREKVTFFIDEKEWQATPHLLNPKSLAEIEEIEHAKQLIERRYEWTPGRLGNNPIIRLKDIVEV